MVRVRASDWEVGCTQAKWDGQAEPLVSPGLKRRLILEAFWGHVMMPRTVGAAGRESKPEWHWTGETTPLLLPRGSMGTGISRMRRLNSQAVRVILATAIPALLILMAPGCHRGPVALVSVKGKVLYQGYPVTGGILVFAPDPNRGGSGPLARAETDADGSYVLKTKDALGAEPGWYRVTIMAVAPAYPAPSGVPSFPVSRSMLPEKYRDPELSGLSCEIKAGLDNNVNFNLD